MDGQLQMTVFDGTVIKQEESAETVPMEVCVTLPGVWGGAHGEQSASGQPGTPGSRKPALHQKSGDDRTGTRTEHDGVQDCVLKPSQYVPTDGDGVKREHVDSDTMPLCVAVDGSSRSRDTKMSDQHIPPMSRFLLHGVVIGGRQEGQHQSDYIKVRKQIREADEQVPPARGLLKRMLLDTHEAESRVCSRSPSESIGSVSNPPVDDLPSVSRCAREDVGVSPPGGSQCNMAGTSIISNQRRSANDLDKGTAQSKETNFEKSCEICGEVCRSPGGLGAHMLFHKSMETLDGDFVECFECKNQIQRTYIKYHVKIHSSEKPLKCNICHKAFHHQQSLTFHLKVHARKKQHHVCQVCRKEFAHEYLLRRHSVIHEKYKCDICGHHGADRYRFLSHMRKHQAKVIYKCDVCTKVYSREAPLISHKRAVHKCSGEINIEKKILYKCDGCGETFPDKSALREHVNFCSSRKLKIEENTVLECSSIIS
ncbi:uncharacterized protein [Haliotis cracherodii]|uniref:uncharacterized protein n=1 Tax=Haliotis cracherodii TaxID=6455 RepID=UPI0039E90C13